MIFSLFDFKKQIRKEDGQKEWAKEITKTKKQITKIKKQIRKTKNIFIRIFFC